ncbi:MAG: ATP-binding protein [Candidatus Kapabacteria bacterium]|nr:ATP-binding protein [Candidatus Kapabacteria bacterium]
MKINRDIYLQKLVNRRHNGMIKVITGMRRCGKSYLLFTLFADFLRNENVPDDHIIKINLEDRRNKALREPDALLEYIDSNIKDENMHYILLDEVQMVEEFEDVLNSYLNVKNADVYVTGSNAKFLSKDVITEFRGRGDEVRVHPLNFKEFASTMPLGSDRYKLLDEFMTFGGLPQTATMNTAEQKKEYLNALFTHTYLKDIKDRYGIKNDGDLEELIDVIASSIGGLTNPLKLQNTFSTVKKSSLSNNTIKLYLEYLQDAFLIEKSIRYDIKGRKYISTPYKYYFEDLGLRNARLNFRQGEQTHLMENLIYNELRFRGLSVDVGQVILNTKNEKDISQRRQLEVDFVCNQGFKRYYIQSALALPTQEKIDQEYKSLLQIKDSFPKIVIVGGMQPTYQDDTGLLVLNIFDFLMDENSLIG